MSACRRWRDWARVLWTTLAVVGCPSRVLAEPFAWTWVAPREVRVVNERGESTESPRNPEDPIPVYPDRLTLIPARPGAQFQLVGETPGLRVGLASGTQSMAPDTVTWIERPPPAWRVPTWTPVRFVVLQSTRPTTVIVRQASPSNDDLHEHRLDIEVSRWVRRRRATLPTSRDPGAARALRQLEALRWLGDRALVGEAQQQHPAFYRWLDEQWLRARLRQRALPAPFFEERRVPLGGTQPVAAVDRFPSDTDDWRILPKEEAVNIPPGDWDVVEVELRARASGRAQARVLEGARLVRDLVFRVPRRAQSPARWTAARSLRLTPHQTLPLRLIASEGELQVRVRAWKARRSWFEARGAHRRNKPESTPATENSSWLAALLGPAHEGHPGDLETALRSLDPALADTSIAQARAALLLRQQLPLLHSPPHVTRAFASFWEATRPLPRRLQSALRLETVRSLVERWSSPLTPPPGGFAALIEAVNASSLRSLDDRLLASLLEVLFTPRDRARPVTLTSLERALEGQAHDREALRLALTAWSRAAPWAALKVLEGTAVDELHPPFEAGLGEASCEVYGERGLRYFLVPKQEQRVDVLDLGGTHSAVTLRPLDPTETDSSRVLFGEQSVQVHPLLGEPSRLALTPGQHALRLESGPPVLARIPWNARLPCNTLREVERWVIVDQSAAFELPAGEGPNLVSFIVDSRSLPADGVRLQFDLGTRRASAEVNAPATGVVSFEAPAGLRTLRVHSDRALKLRGRVRLHPGVARHHRDEHSAPAKRANAEEKLAKITRVSRELWTARGEEERSRLLTRRGRLVGQLGYRSLALLDLRRAGHTVTDLGERAGARFLPHRPEAVVALSFAASAPLLPPPVSPSLVTELRRRLAPPSRATIEIASLQASLLQRVGLYGRNDSGALALARFASMAGHPELAGPLFERLASTTGSETLWDSAAEEYHRLALSTQRLDYAKRAFALSRQALLKGAPRRSRAASHRSTIRWESPSLSALAQSTLRVSSRQQPSTSEQSLLEQLERALMVAPSEAQILHASKQFSLNHLRDASLRLRVRCFLREGPGEHCEPRIAIDNRPVACHPPSSSSASDPSLRLCPLHSGPNSRRLSVQLPAASRPMAWTLLEKQSDEGGEAPSTAPQRIHFAKLARQRETSFDVTGPVVIRFRVRSFRAEPAELHFRADPVDPAHAKSTEGAWRPWTVSGVPDPSSLSRFEPESFSREQRFEHVITSAGRHRLRLRAVGADLAIRPEVAYVDAPPAGLSPETAPAVAKESPDAPRRSPAPGVTPAAPPTQRQLLSASASFRAVDRDLSDSDDDSRDRFAELELLGRRQVGNGVLWVAGSGLARVRDGASSLGARLRLDTNPRGVWPGMFASGRIVSQPTVGAFGARAQLGVFQRTSLAPWLTLRATASATARAIDETLRGRPDADGDIYSAYARFRAQTFDGALSLTHRPFVDTVSSYSTRIRLNPGLSSVDRVEVRGRLQVLPGTGISPWLRLNAGVSHRPASNYRRRAFTRLSLGPQVSFWHWLGFDQRSRAELSLSAFVDSPKGSSGAGLFLALAAHHDLLMGAGLDDYRPSARPFRARLEEGGPPKKPRAPPNDAAWSRESPP